MSRMSQSLQKKVFTNSDDSKSSSTLYPDLPVNKLFRHTYILQDWHYQALDTNGHASSYSARSRTAPFTALPLRMYPMPGPSDSSVTML
ncbi:hypothetical protein ElyMa_004406200 [Elysia marginata]|uniref:Uncharacterized protein n=1 Tax=Elysia marginata TaxID=1093978 RepID=A0AAV4HCI6_9GAST|nr:hypothetical protein ElyMa_004406200 [Elysia marginata]